MTPNGNGNTVLAVAQQGFRYHLHEPRPLPPHAAPLPLVLSQLFHVMSPLFRGFLAALAFHFDSLASKEKKRKKRHLFLSLSPFLTLFLSLSLTLLLSLAGSFCFIC